MVKASVRAKGKHQGALKEMAKGGSNPDHIKCLSRLLQGCWRGCGQTDSSATAGPQQISVRALERLKVLGHVPRSSREEQESPLKRTVPPGLSHRGCPIGAVPPGLSHHHHRQLSCQMWGLTNSRPDALQRIPRSQPGISPRQCWQGGTQRVHPEFPPRALKEQWPMCPSEAPPAARGPSRPPNTLLLVRFGRGSGGAAGISCHRPPSLPGGGHAAPAPRPWDPQGT